MSEMIRWDDLRLFLAVARAGGLAGARGPSGLSAPTLGRRMLALERALGVALFERHRDGYALTAAGRDLLGRAQELEQGALGVERWRMAIDPQPAVRIAAGPWTSIFIARRLPELLEVEGMPRIELATGAGLADLSRREANLGIRNRRPDLAGLAGRRLCRVAFAVYGAASLVRAQPQADQRRFAACEWITLAAETAVPSSRWLDRQLQRPPILTCSMPAPLLDAAVAGVGLCVLPCFIGDDDPRLARASSPILELGHEQWLVSHDEDRHHPPIRLVADRTARLFMQCRPLFAGASVS